MAMSCLQKWIFCYMFIVNNLIITQFHLKHGLFPWTLRTTFYWSWPVCISVWDQAKCSRFNWLWYNTTTYASYHEETSYENSLLVQQTGGLALSSLTHVMKSLTPNAKGIFLMLAEYQLENKDNSTYIGKKIFLHKWVMTWEKWLSGLPTRSYTNKPVQKKVRSLKFWTYK